MLAWLLAGRLTRQLQILSLAADSIRQGKAGAAIPALTGMSEVASVSAAFNALIADLNVAAVMERKRIARELHDSVTQTLFSSAMLADILPTLWETDPTLGRTKLQELRSSVRGASAEMRTLLLELRR